MGTRISDRATEDAASRAEYDRRHAAIFYAKTDLDVPDATLRGLRDQTSDQLGISLDRVKRAFERAVGPVGPVTALSSQGTFHRLFRAESPRWRPLILRASVPLGGTDWGLWLDGQAHALTRGRGVPGPALHAIERADSEVPFDFAIMDEVSGTCLRDLDSDEPAMLAALHAVGRQLEVVHRIRGVGFGPPRAGTPLLGGLHTSWRDYVLLRLPDHVDACVAAGLLTNGKDERLLRIAESFPLPSETSLLHCDLGSHNLFVQNDGVSAILDWEDCVLGDPVLDLALWATFQPRRRHGAMLSGYYDARPRPPSFDARFWFYFMRVTLAKVVHRLRFGYPDVPGRPTLRERVAEAFAEMERACASS